MTTPPDPSLTGGSHAAVETPQHSTHSSWGRAIGTALAASAIVAIVLVAFLWPTATSKVRNPPVGVVATQEQYDQFVQKAQDSASAQGTDLPFTFTRIADRPAAVRAIEHRDVYGAYVMPADSQQRLEVLTAPAASPAVATMLTRSASSMVSGQARAMIAQMQHATPAAPANPAAQKTMMAGLLQKMDSALAGPKVTAVVPLSDDDSQGSGLAVASLPLTIGGIVGGMLLSTRLRGTWRRVLGVVIYAVVGGIIMVAVLDTWFGFAPAPTLELWGAITLSLAATVGLIVGLHSALGGAGLGIGAIITMLIGNPLSAAQAPMEFLPRPFGTIGQYLVPGATGTLVRDLSYFPAADLTRPWLVLAGWVALGLVLIVVGHHRTGGHGHPAAEA